MGWRFLTCQIEGMGILVLRYFVRPLTWLHAQKGGDVVDSFFESFGRTEGKGLLFLKGVSHLFPGSSKIRLQYFLNVVRHGHFEVFQLVGNKQGSVKESPSYTTRTEGTG